MRKKIEFSEDFISFLDEKIEPEVVEEHEELDEYE